MHSGVVNQLGFRAESRDLRSLKLIGIGVANLGDAERRNARAGSARPPVADWPSSIRSFMRRMGRSMGRAWALPHSRTGLEARADKVIKPRRCSTPETPFHSPKYR